MTPEPGKGGPELTVLTLTLNEENSIGRFFERVLPVLKDQMQDFELLVVDGASTDKTVALARAAGARVERQSRPGYGNAYREGLSLARGRYILTLDADSSHPMELFQEFWRRRREYSLVMGSRYLKGSADTRPWGRRLLSRVLNWAYRWALWLPLTDISGGFRLYRAEDVQRMPSVAPFYDAVAEIAVLIHAGGLRVCEIPYRYVPRVEDESKARIVRFGISYAKTLLRLWWRLRVTGEPRASGQPAC